MYIMAHAFLLEEQKWIFGMPILMITLEPFISPQFLQAGMMEEQFTFTIRFVLLTGRRKPWSGQHNCTSTIPSMEQVHEQSPYNNHGPAQTTTKKI